VSDWNREQSEGERVQREWTKERLYTRAEVEALLAKQREACAQELAVWLFESRAAQTVVRATPLVEVKP